MQLAFTVPIEHPAIPGHFPGMPIAPAAVLLDEITHRFTQTTGRQLNRVKQVRFTAPLVPGQQLDVQYQPKNSAEYRFIGTEKGNPVMKGALDYTVTEPKYVPLLASSAATPPHADTSLGDCYRQLPHAGTMCLLDRLLHHDAQRIVCLAQAQQAHPLSRSGQLPAWASLEYAAQALACHGLLTLQAHSAAADTAAAGFTQAMIIGVREMICYAATINLSQPCHIDVSLLAQQPGAASCTFSLSQAGAAVSSGQFNILYRTANPDTGCNTQL